MKRPAELLTPSGPVSSDSNKQQKLDGKRLAVSVLCGFLGAGKTTLLKHILEAKHTENSSFRCAVIVNDVAELNIDKNLIDDSGLIQSEDAIAMQNGCVCCSLKDDLLNQIVELAKKKVFDYMIIEASGVSEPSQIAKLFVDCDEDHDHTEHSGPTLGEVARLDTCVTVVDSADFYSNFDAIKQGPQVGSFPQLLVEQIEYANVVILNKSDLVEKANLERITEQVALLNPTAKVLASNNSRIDVMEVVNTQLYKAADFDKFHKLMPEIPEEEVKSCCKAKVAKGETPCCLRKRTVDSGRSKVLLAPGTSGDTRHAARFGITSFLYKARRPFHPDRLQDNFASKFFIVDNPEELRPESETSQGDKKENNGQDAPGKNATDQIGHQNAEMKTHDTKGDKDTQQDEPKEKRVDPADRKAKSFAELTKQCEDGYAPTEIAAYWETMTPPRDWRKEASEKEALRTKHFGALFRSKGFMWYANYNELKSVWNHAGNLAKLSRGGPWTVLEAKAWVGTKQEQAELRKDWVEPWGDRRQDLVFIGKDLDHKAIQEALDGCLLNDEELAMGIDYWRATMDDEGLKLTVKASAMHNA